MSIQDQVDHLIDTRPGRELMVPTYDETAHPVVDGLVHRSGAPLRRTWCSPTPAG